jgi:hypothetical protein
VCCWIAAADASSWQHDDLSATADEKLFVTDWEVKMDAQGQNIILVASLLLLIFGAAYSRPLQVEVAGKATRPVGRVALVGFFPVTKGSICVIEDGSGQKRKARSAACEALEEGGSYSVRVWLNGDIRRVK